MHLDFNSSFSEQYAQEQPTKLRRLSLQWDSSTSEVKLEPAFEAIPEQFDSLCFSAVNLSKLSDEGLLALKSIPAHVKTILIRHIFMIASHKLAIAIAALPVETLSFTENDFSFSTAAFFKTVFPAVRAKHLQLTATSLHKLNAGGVGLGLALEAISAFVEILDLDSNALGSLRAANFNMVMSKIPGSILVLNLAKTQLESLTDEELSAGILLLKAPLSALNLSANDLNKWGFKLTMGSLPASLTFLDLSNTGLEYFSETNLIAHFQAINPKINNLHIKLSGNSLGQSLGLEGLGKVLAALPPGISSIDLSNNDFEYFTTEQWIFLINKMPLSLTDLKCNGPSQEKINWIFQNIRQHAFNIAMMTTGLSKDVANTVMSYAVSNHAFFNGSQAMEMKQEELKELVLR